MIRKLFTRFGLLTTVLFSSTVAALEPTEGMTITGDQELPQVLYITPWKEQMPAMPATPVMKEPILSPLTPCDTGQPMTDYQVKLWSCPSAKPESSP